MGRFARGALVGFLFTLTVGLWPAGATVSNVKVTSPTQNQILDGAYSSDGTPSGFTVNLRGSATTDCNGFSDIKFTVTGPSYSNTWSLSASSTKNWSGGPSSPWNTQDLKNGIFTVTLRATEAGGLLCENETGSGYITAKVANPAVAPSWVGSPAAASDGSATVTFSWKKNSEADIVEYHITRSGPGGNVGIVVGAANPGTGCSLSGTTYSCTDPASNFPNPYGGTYSYSITAMRSRPAFNSGETVTNCVVNDQPCVESSASDVKQVTLTDPTPTPTPTPTDTPTATPTPGGRPTIGIGTPGTGGGSGGSGRGTSVLGGGFSGGGGFGSNPFYSGTYEERLPYTPKSLIVGNGTAPSNGSVQAGSVSADAPNYRTVMLPVAGGLLAFLSAAHVRRLLVHF
jgi:hypothetical protein